jgi:hypothetical protein
MFAAEPPIDPDSPDYHKIPFSDFDDNRQPRGTAGKEGISAATKAAIDDLRQTIRSNLLNYQKRYRKTGQLDFIPFEIVARMAAEGYVFVPDHAEQKIQQIVTAAQGVQNAALALQEALLDLAGHQGRREAALRHLLKLNEESIVLITVVERDVMPIVGIVSMQRKLEIEQALHELEMLVSYFVKQFEEEIVATTARSERTKQPEASMANYLTQFMSKNQLVAIVSTEIIKARVPFYRLSA